MYHYFISFAYSQGFGSTEYSAKKPIEDIEHIRELEKEIL